MPVSKSLNGYLLCGGASRRLGEDKARLPHPKGGTLIERTVRLAATVCDRITLLSGQPPRYPELHLNELKDRRTGCGPMGGIGAALTHTGAQPALVLPVDLPHLEEEHLILLCESYFREEPSLTVAASTDGWHPVLGVWSSACHGPVERALDCGELKLQDLVRKLEALPVALPYAALLNWNEPGDV